jgi:hypothetical protein
VVKDSHAERKNHMNQSRRYRRVMSLAETEGMSPALLFQLRAQGVLPPLAGGSPEADEGGGDHDGEGGGTPPSDANADSDDEGDDAADDDEPDNDPDSRTKNKRTRSKRSSSSSSSSDDDEGEGYVRMPRSEIQRLRREARETKAALNKREAEERTRREKDMADQEKWKDLAESREERITEMEGEMEALRMERTKDERKANIIKVAKRLSFEYPDDAHRFLDVDDMEDEQSIESALKTILRERPKLKSKRRGSGAPIPGESDNDGKGGGLTIEDVKQMSPAEINKRWTEVQAVMRANEVAAS